MKQLAVFISVLILIFTACKPEINMEITKVKLEQFVKDYIETWSTKNSNDRQRLIEKVYSPSANFYANEPGDDAVELQGWNKIFENITRVNERLVIGNGLITELTGFSENHNALRITWQMKTPKGDIVMKGMNFLILNNSKKIEKDYIYIN